MSTLDTLISAMESAANLMRGVALDPRVPREAAESLRAKASELDDLADRVAEAEVAELERQDAAGGALA